MSNPRIDDAAFFEMLNEADLAQLDRTKGEFPWQQRTYGDDPVAAEDSMRSHYKRLGLAMPKMAWATSPAALWSALTMLKTLGMKSALIDSLMPKSGLQFDDTIAIESKRTLLSAIIADDVIVSTGAPLSRQLGWKRLASPPRAYRAILDADTIIRQNARASDTLARSSAAAGWGDAALYPLLYSEADMHLAANCFCVLPFVKLCLFCKPPMYVHTDPHGNLHCESRPAIAWADGYALDKVYVEPRPALPEPSDKTGEPNETARLLNRAVMGLISRGDDSLDEKAQ